MMKMGSKMRISCDGKRMSGHYIGCGDVVVANLQQGLGTMSGRKVRRLVIWTWWTNGLWTGRRDTQLVVGCNVAPTWSFEKTNM